MNQATLKDIIAWDIENWSKALNYWEKHIDLDAKNLNCLELGARGGGLSLWLALKGNKVMCSDFESPEKSASQIHKKYSVEKYTRYQAIDATTIPYENEFDVVAFKSILGAVSRYDNNNLKKRMIDEIYKALKENGVLLFAENLESSFLHKLLRKKFAVWGEWNYLRLEEMQHIFSSFKTVEYITVGFFGTFGRTETQRSILGKFDRFFEKLVPKSKRYIVIGIARK